MLALKHGREPKDSRGGFDLMLARNRNGSQLTPQQVTAESHRQLADWYGRTAPPESAEHATEEAELSGWSSLCDQAHRDRQKLWGQRRAEREARVGGAATDSRTRHGIATGDAAGVAEVATAVGEVPNAGLNGGPEPDGGREAAEDTDHDSYDPWQTGAPDPYPEVFLSNNWTPEPGQGTHAPHQDVDLPPLAEEATRSVF